MLALGTCLLAACSSTPPESMCEWPADYYDASEFRVQPFPVGKVRTVDCAPTAEEIASADAAIDAAGGAGPKLAPPLAVRNVDGTCTLIAGGIEANRLIRRLGDLPPETTIPLRVVGNNRETMLMNSAYDPNVPKRTWKSDDFDAMAVITNLQHYVLDEENWQQNMTNQMDRLYRLAKATTNDFIRAFMSVTNLLGRSDSYCRASLKGRERAYAKTVKNLPETGGWPNVNSVCDVFGCTFVLGDEDNFAKALALVKAEFEKCGFRAVCIKNCYYTGSVKTSGYADIKVNVRHENGFTCEIILIEANMNREKREGVSHEVYEIRRDYDASTSAAKDGYLRRIMDELDHLMRLVHFNPRGEDSQDQFQETYDYLVHNLPALRNEKYTEIWSANTRSNLEDYIARISDPVMYDGYRARRVELAARSAIVRPPLYVE